MDRKLDLDLYVQAAMSDARSLHKILDDLIALRVSLKLNQTQLGRLMGVSQAAISAIESEESNPLVETLQKYARALDAKFEMSIDYLKYSDTSKTFQSNSGLCPMNIDNSILPNTF